MYSKDFKNSGRRPSGEPDEHSELCDRGRIPQVNAPKTIVPALDAGIGEEYMKYRLRWIILGTLCACGLYSGLWWVLSEHMRSRIVDNIQRLRGEGCEITYAHMRVRGYPFQLKVMMTDPRLTIKDKIQTWIEGDLEFRAVLWNHRYVGFRCEGPHHMVINEPVAHFGAFMGWNGRGECNLKDIQVARLQYDRAQVEGSGKVQLADIENFDVQLERVSSDDKKPPKLFTSHINIGALSGPILKGNVMGDSIRSIDLKVDFSGVPSGITLKERLQSWYQEGGAIDIANFAFQWGKLNMQTEGTVSLDNNLQPMVALSFDGGSIDSVLEALVAADIIKQKHIKGIKTAIQLLLNPESAPRIGITLQDSALSIGPMTILKIPRIQWPVSLGDKTPSGHIPNQNEDTGF